jgi:hypothetical protein
LDTVLQQSPLLVWLMLLLGWLLVSSFYFSFVQLGVGRLINELNHLSNAIYTKYKVLKFCRAL